MPALSRRSGREAGLNAWPGYVDALSTLLMVIIFVLLVFVLAQGFLSVVLSSRDRALDRLNRQVSELAELLSLERAETQSLRLGLERAASDVRIAVAARDLAVTLLREARQEATALTAERDAGRTERGVLAARLAELELGSRAAETRLTEAQSALTESLARADMAGSEAARALARTREALSAREAALAESTRLATAEAAARRSAESRVAELERGLAATGASLAGERSARQAAEQETRGIRAALDTARAGLATTTARLLETTAARDELGRQAEALRTDLSASARQAEALRTQLATAARQAQDAQRQAETLRGELAGTARQLSETQRQAQATEAARAAAQGQAEALRRDLGQATRQAQEAGAARADAARQADALRAELATLGRQAEAERAAASARAAELARLNEQVRSLTALRDQLERQAREAEARAGEGERRRAAAEAARGEEARLGEAARAQVALLGRQIDTLRAELARVAAALTVAEGAARDREVQVAQLGERLNLALAARVEELQRYRSDFFGRLRDVLGDRPDVRIAGDRFVFQSEVLFPPASAEPTERGREQIRAIGRVLTELAQRIPPEVNWLLRVDGHADRNPIRGGRFASNWELSAARAIAVAQLLIADGIPRERIAAAAFGENQPLDAGETPDSLARNRRIELRLTDR